MKKALVLAGGGTRGIYQNGVLHALRLLNKDSFDIVTGTSIGALNGALIVQKDYEAMDELWHNLTQDQIIEGAFTTDMNLDTMINERNQIASFFTNYIKEKGADTSPFRARIKKMFQPKKFFASEIDFGCIVLDKDTQKPIYVTKEMMKENGSDWLIASTSAFPAFPVYHFNDQTYVDGGYFDNLPIDFALRLGAEQIIAVDLRTQPQHPQYLNRKNITYIHPHEQTGNFLSFDRQILDRLEILGFNDTMKAFHVYEGVKYTFNHWHNPTYFDSFIFDLLRLETDIKLATNINERLRANDLIQQEIQKQQGKVSVSDEELFFGILDNIMDLCEFYSTKVYRYKEVRNQICVSFSACLDEDYPFFPKLTPKEILEYVDNMDRKGIVEKIVHVHFYPDHMRIPRNILLTVYPFECAMAQLIVTMMNELKEEA